ncbi:hypothetical protein F4V43_13810 [Paenibacillus spiritus]|uniref:Uncharacterized protein n=1 Tax=Paenibacillus spiritus TaxID=2496557 RepID=A0A5J5G575_9BACL|nr:MULTISPECIES: hypothetical protein [Paenibacillus]KAA9002130.1 hypothetical protein F4V43_13810 [Paenibacillus spiritus]
MESKETDKRVTGRAGGIRLEEPAGDSGESGCKEKHYSADAIGGSEERRVPFWTFPYGRGRFQPWRRRLWELESQ